MNIKKIRIWTYSVIAVFFVAAFAIIVSAYTGKDEQAAAETGITEDKNRTTRVEAINIAGTLNCNSGKEKPITRVPVLKMPTQFYHIGFKSDSDNTVEVVCDEGWQISMRIHNASSRVEPSLIFDVQLISFPSSVYAQVEPWETEDERRANRLNAYVKNLKG